jgi:hypothetical protein
MPPDVQAIMSVTIELLAYRIVNRAHHDCDRFSGQWGLLPLFATTGTQLRSLGILSEDIHDV